MLKKHPTRLQLRKAFTYRHGFLYWRIVKGGKNIGQKAGTNTAFGYRKIGFQEAEFFAHRLIWIWHYGVTNRFIDHINHNKQDNRIRNLRLATKANNEWHTPKRSHNTSGFKGVYCCKTTAPKPYWAYITVNGTRRGLGMFSSPRIAAQAYDRAAKKLHGKFACLNNI